MTRLQKIIAAFASVTILVGGWAATRDNEPIYIKHTRVYEGNREIIVEGELGRDKTKCMSNGELINKSTFEDDYPDIKCENPLFGETILLMNDERLAIIYDGKDSDLVKINSQRISKEDAIIIIKEWTNSTEVNFINSGHKKGFPKFNP